MFSSNTLGKAVFAPGDFTVECLFGQVAPGEDKEEKIILLDSDKGKFGLYQDRELGRGAYSIVRAGKRMDDGEVVAVKCIDTVSLRLRDRKALEDEVRVMRMLDHPGLVRMFADVHGNAGMYYIVMECVEGGELFDRVVELEAYTEVQARATAVTLLTALHYLHGRNIAHRGWCGKGLFFLLLFFSFLSSSSFISKESTLCWVSCLSLAPRFRSRGRSEAGKFAAEE